VIRIQRTSGTFLPTLEQHHLLRAALLHDAQLVRESFEQWKASVHIDVADRGSARVFPLLYRNLTRLGIDDPLLPRLKGVFRQVWFRNQLILEHGLRALRALQEEAIPVIVLKGASLIATGVYDEPALRPMEDFDLLVPRERFAAAVEVLRRTRWAFQPELLDPEPHYVFQHAVGFRREGGGEIDLHWAATGLPLDRNGERAAWESSRAVRFGELEALALAPADQLLQVCTHATLLNEHIPPIRWAADATLLLRRHDAFPWDTFVELARERNLSRIASRCLEYLRDGLAVAVPDEVMRALARNERMAERLPIALRNAGGRFVYAQFFAEWMRHAFAEPAAAPRRLLLLPRFLRSYCRVASTGALLRLVTSRLALNTRRATTAPE